MTFTERLKWMERTQRRPLKQFYNVVTAKNVLTSMGYFDELMTIEEMIQYNPYRYLNIRNFAFYATPGMHTTEKWFVWIAIPKNGFHYASRRMKVLRKHRHEHAGPGSLTLEMLNAAPNFHKMVVLREPVGRAISCYQEMIKVRTDLPYSTPITKKMEFFKCRDDVIRSFCCFLEEINEYGFYDLHLSPQAEILQSFDTSVEQIEHVILLSNIQEEIDKIIKIYNLDSEPHENSMSGFINKGDSSVKNQIKEFLNTNIQYKNLLEQVYHDDFELWERVKK